MGIDLDEISLTATFPFDPDLDFFCSRSLNNFWPDCKAIPAYGLMMSVRPSVCPSVNIWLTSVFKFVIGHINQYRLYTLHGNRP